MSKILNSEPILFGSLLRPVLSWIYFLVPDTRLEIPEEMDNAFQDIASEEKEAKRKAIERDMITNAGQRSGHELMP